MTRGPEPAGTPGVALPHAGRMYTRRPTALQPGEIDLT
jgi:hypothetical protein